jgi:hypothetical protein
MEEFNAEDAENAEEKRERLLIHIQPASDELSP